MSPRDRIRQIIEQWFLTEPLLFAAWTTHNLRLEPRIATIRVRQGKVEYNPAFIDALAKRELEAVLRFEAMRIILKHPYQRRKENAAIAYLASNVTLQEYLQTTLPFPSARDLFGTDEFNQQYFERYYQQLLALADSADSGSTNPGPTTRAQGTSAGGAGATSATAREPDGDNGKAATATADEQTTDAPVSDQLTGSTPLPNPSPLNAYTDGTVTAKENTEDWDENTLFDERLNAVIRGAQESNRWGTVTGKLREQILAALKPKLDYRTVLRQFRASILSTERVLTRMKPSRRYGFQYMGSRRDFTTRLLFAVDVSGSIPSADLARGFSLINQFSRYGIESVDVIQLMLIEAEPQKFYQPPYVGVRGWVGIELAVIDDAELAHHIETAWRLIA